MKRLITAAVLFTAALGAQTAGDKKPAQAASTPNAPATIPKDAVKNTDGSYTYTDKQGQRWVYANTPFGVTRSPEAKPDKPRAADDITKAIDKGDTVQFEHATPFGTLKWEKKKSELTDDDRAIIEQQARSAGKQTETAKSDAK